MESALPLTLDRGRPRYNQVPVQCEERQRLARIYVGALARSSEIANAIEKLKDERLREDQREATKNIQVACETAIADLNRYRAEHGG